MTLDERLTRAAHQVADGLHPPVVDLDGVRARARSNRRRTAAVAVTAAAVAAVIAVSATLGGGKSTSTPPIAPPTGWHSACPAGPQERPRKPYVDAAVVEAQRAWLDDLPTGGPPLTPWWHDGVLHVGETEVRTPFQVTAELIQAAGDSVLVGDPSWNDQSGRAEWAVVRDGRLEMLPTGDSDPNLSSDGRLAYWYEDPEAGSGPVVVWDVVADRELAARKLPGYVLGIDGHGIAYVQGGDGPTSVTAWDVRADTMTATSLTWDPATSLDDPCAALTDLMVWRLESGYVSPDGTRQLFTGPAPGDTSDDCCITRLRVRAVGPIESVGRREVDSLDLPEGIPHETLWHSYSDRGTWGVWWESDDTVLLDAIIDGNSYLVRCPVTGDSCELVFDLGPIRDPALPPGLVYDPAWVSDWAFAHAPLTH